MMGFLNFLFNSLDNIFLELYKLSNSIRNFLHVLLNRLDNFINFLIIFIYFLYQNIR
jgi:hypothetical protein